MYLSGLSIARAPQPCSQQQLRCIDDNLIRDLVWKEHALKQEAIFERMHDEGQELR